MDRHDHFGSRCDRVSNARGVEIVSLWIDIDEDWCGAETSDRCRRSEERERSRDHFIARFDIERHQGEEQSIRAGGAANRMFCLAILRDRLLEFTDFIPEDEAL